MKMKSIKLPQGVNL